MKKKYTNAQRQNALDLREKGLSAGKISKKTGVNTSTLWTWFNPEKSKAAAIATRMKRKNKKLKTKTKKLQAVVNETAVRAPKKIKFIRPATTHATLNGNDSKKLFMFYGEVDAIVAAMAIVN